MWPPLMVYNLALYRLFMLDFFTCSMKILFYFIDLFFCIVEVRWGMEDICIVGQKYIDQIYAARGEIGLRISKTSTINIDVMWRRIFNYGPSSGRSCRNIPWQNTVLVCSSFILLLLFFFLLFDNRQGAWIIKYRSYQCQIWKRNSWIHTG